MPRVACGWIRDHIMIGIQVLTIVGTGDHRKAWTGAQSGPEPGQCASTQSFLTLQWSWVMLGN